jgi:hypothetical protein
VQVRGKLGALAARRQLLLREQQDGCSFEALAQRLVEPAVQADRQLQQLRAQLAEARAQVGPLPGPSARSMPHGAGSYCAGF